MQRLRSTPPRRNRNVNPHPNYLVGGAPCSINLDETAAINAERLAYVGRLLDQANNSATVLSAF
jgi:Ni,Fe-hydrogenase I large subunit